MHMLKVVSEVVHHKAKSFLAVTAKINGMFVSMGMCCGFLGDSLTWVGLPRPHSIGTRVLF